MMSLECGLVRSKSLDLVQFSGTGDNTCQSDGRLGSDGVVMPIEIMIVPRTSCTICPRLTLVDTVQHLSLALLYGVWSTVSVTWRTCCVWEGNATRNQSAERSGTQT